MADVLLMRPSVVAAHDRAWGGLMPVEVFETGRLGDGSDPCHPRHCVLRLPMITREELLPFLQAVEEIDIVFPGGPKQVKRQREYTFANVPGHIRNALENDQFLVLNVSLAQVTSFLEQWVA